MLLLAAFFLGGLRPPQTPHLGVRETGAERSGRVGGNALIFRALYSPYSLEVWEWVGPKVKEGTLHAKFALFDEELAIVGSYNLDPRSARLNSETAVAVEDPEIVQELRDHLDAEDLKLARQVGWEEAQGYKNPEDLSEKFDLLFALPMKGWL